MKRREFMGASLGVLATSLLARQAFAQDKKPVTWWYETATPENRDNLQRLLTDPFNAANPGSELTIDYRGSELDKQLRVALLSGSGPDVVYTAGPSYVASIARAGQLLPLDDYAAKYGWSDRLLAVFIELGKYDGKLYALPKTYETLGLFYNKTLFDKNGWAPPTTTAELETVADALLAQNITPFAAGNADWRPTNEHYVSIVLNSIAGPDNVYQALTGAIPWTAEPFVKAIDTLNNWWQKGYFGPNYFSLTGEQAFAQVATGQAGAWPRPAPGTSAMSAASSRRPMPKPALLASHPIRLLAPRSMRSASARPSRSPRPPQNPDGAAAVIDYVFSDKFYGDINSVWQGEWNMPLKDLSKVQVAAEVLPLYTEAMKNLASSVNDGQYGYTTWTFMPPASVTYLVSGIEECGSRRPPWPTTSRSSTTPSSRKSPKENSPPFRRADPFVLPRRNRRQHRAAACPHGVCQCIGSTWSRRCSSTRSSSSFRPC